MSAQALIACLRYRERDIRAVLDTFKTGTLSTTPVHPRINAAEAGLEALVGSAEVLIVEVVGLIEMWDMSVDVLGPEWNALAEKMESVRRAVTA